MYIKDFDKWNEVKKQTDTNSTKVYIRSGEIRWISFGVNIGSEMDGKGNSFTRPGLVLHVIGSHLALVAPLSTKIKDTVGYFPFEWKGITTALCLHQVRVISQKRILSRKGRISEERLKFVKAEVVKFYSF